MRYFFFSYSFYSRYKSGKGYVLIENEKFPSSELVEDEAKEGLIEIFGNKDFSIVIENFIEMNAEDFNNFCN